MRLIASSFIIGLIFGLGLVISQMVNPAKVLGFLDIAGNWDPSLALVMAGAVAVSSVGFALAGRRIKPVWARAFLLPDRRDMDARLVIGAPLFGIGWGLVGLCPGPALTSLSLGLWQVTVFVGAMLAGMALYQSYARLAGPAAKSTPH